MTTTKWAVNQERLARLLDASIHLKHGTGAGANGQIDVCVMQAVDWLAGGKGATDSPPCASAAIAKFCIRLNDSVLFGAFRDDLKPFAAKIVGTACGRTAEKKRAYIAADWACRVIAPMALEARGFKEHAQALRGLDPVVDKASAQRARAAASAATAAYGAAAATAASAYATAYAATAAYAASDAAYGAAAAAYGAAAATAATAAYGAASAAATAYAATAAYGAATAAASAAYAASDAANKRVIWDSALDCLQRMINVK